MTTPKTPRKMVALKVLETSGVDHPAHLHEGWVVMKDANAPEDTVADNETVELNDEFVDRVVELEAELAKAHEKIADLTDELAKSKTDPEPQPEPQPEDEVDAIVKSLPEPVREMLAKAQSEADAAREELRKAKEAERDREFVAKAAGWQNLNIDATEFGVALRKVADINSELAEVISGAFDAANAQQEAAAIFSELGGAGRHENGNTFGRVQGLAKAAVASGEYGTVEQAIAGLIAQNPDLYNEYLAEKR